MSVQMRSDELPLDASVLDALATRLVDPLARRVVEVMKEEGVVAQAPVSHRWLDATAVAERLGMTREWVYEHASELGAVRIGGGSRPRLRFPPDVGRTEHNHGGRTRAETPRQSDRRARGLIAVYDG
jgi:predicted DNA-binding transcriptional regulator AlpA